MHKIDKTGKKTKNKICPKNRNLIFPQTKRIASPIEFECLLYLIFTQCPGDTVQTGKGKVDPARKFKCTTAARAQTMQSLYSKVTIY